jgi:Na+-translocating ferredoxin:NAD+ oxidoreductase subunit G
MNFSAQIKSVLLLTLFALASVVIISGIERNTRKAALANQKEYSARQLQQVLKQVSYDNMPWESAKLINKQQGGTKIISIYKVISNDYQIATVIESENARGYVGPIRLLVAIDIAGNIIGTTVVAHRETPGIGDKIEVSRSDWLKNFSMHSLSKPESGRWKSKKDGGDFDHISGATVTSRTAINIIKDTLKFYALLSNESGISNTN